MSNYDVNIQINGSLDVVQTKKNINEGIKKVENELKAINFKVLDEKTAAQTYTRLTDISKITNKLKNEYKSFGDVTVKTFKDSEGAITRFDAEIKNSIGIVAKLRYELGAKKGTFNLINSEQVDRTMQKTKELSQQIELFKKKLATGQKQQDPFMAKGALTRLVGQINELSPTTANATHKMKQLQIEYTKLQNAAKMKFESVSKLFKDIGDANRQITILTAKMDSAKRAGETATELQLKNQLRQQELNLVSLKAERTKAIRGIGKEIVNNMEIQVRLQRTITEGKNKSALAGAKSIDAESKNKITESKNAYKELTNAVTKLFALEKEMISLKQSGNNNAILAQKQRIQLAQKEVSILTADIGTKKLTSKERELALAKQLSELTNKNTMLELKSVDIQDNINAKLKIQVDAFKKMTMYKIEMANKAGALKLINPEDQKNLIHMYTQMKNLTPTTMDVKNKMKELGFEINLILQKTKELASESKAKHATLASLYSQEEQSLKKIHALELAINKAKVTHTNESPIYKGLLAEKEAEVKVQQRITQAIITTNQALNKLNVATQAQKDNMARREAQTVTAGAKEKENINAITHQYNQLTQAVSNFGASKLKAHVKDIEYKDSSGKDQIKTYQQLLDQIKNFNIANDGAGKGIKRLSAELSEFKGVASAAYNEATLKARELRRVQELGTAKMRLPVDAATGLGAIKEADMIKYVTQLYGKKAQIVKSSYEQLDKYGQNISRVSVKVQEGAKAFRVYEVAATAAGKSVHAVSGQLQHTSAKDLSLFGQFQVAMERFPIWIAASTAFMQTVNAIKGSIKYIFEMDTALVELSKVTDLSTAKLSMMKDVAVELGQALGHSSVEIMKSMAEFGRVNKNTEDIIRLSKVATVASNVTTMSAQAAASAMNSAMISFRINAKDSMSILDGWNEIQNNFRTTAEDLAAGIEKVGVIARQSGTSIHELEGYITAINSAMGLSGAESGTAYFHYLG